VGGRPWSAGISITPPRGVVTRYVARQYTDMGPPSAVPGLAAPPPPPPPATLSLEAREDVADRETVRTSDAPPRLLLHRRRSRRR
jgi:hypothetical protein